MLDWANAVLFALDSEAFDSGSEFICECVDIDLYA